MLQYVEMYLLPHLKYKCIRRLRQLPATKVF